LNAADIADVGRASADVGRASARASRVEASGPRLGLNMHPKWLRGGTAHAFLSPLRDLGLSVLEFRLDLSASNWTETRALIEECRRLGFRLTFHAPFKRPHNPAGFSGPRRGEIEALYAPSIDYAGRITADLADGMGSGSLLLAGGGLGWGSVPLVVHGAKGDRPREQLRRDTVAFLTWILERAPGLHPALEILSRDPDVAKVGDNKAELVDVVSAVDSPRVGICWDLGHDARNGSQAPPADFVARVTHVHVHDITPDGEDHGPLIFGNVPYIDYLRQLGEVGFRGVIILEVNGHLVCDLADAQGIQPDDLLQHSLNELTRLISAW